MVWLRRSIYTLSLPHVIIICTILIFLLFTIHFLTAFHDLGLIGLLVLTLLVVYPLYKPLIILLQRTHSFHRPSSSGNYYNNLTDFTYTFGLFLSSQSLVLLFFDSDILFIQPFFSTLFWFFYGAFDLISSSRRTALT